MIKAIALITIVFCCTSHLSTAKNIPMTSSPHTQSCKKEQKNKQQHHNLQKKAGPQKGLKHGLKDGLKHGLKRGLKKGKINGEKH